MYTHVKCIKGTTQERNSPLLPSPKLLLSASPASPFPSTTNLTMRGESPEPLARKLTHRVEYVYQHDKDKSSSPQSISDAPTTVKDTRPIDALKQLFCGGLAGSVAKTITAPLSRLTILYQGNSY